MFCVVEITVVDWILDSSVLDAFVVEVFEGGSTELELELELVVGFMFDVMTETEVDGDTIAVGLEGGTEGLELVGGTEGLELVGGTVELLLMLCVVLEVATELELVDGVCLMSSRR